MTAPARRNRPVSYSHGVALSDETSGTGHPRRIYLDNAATSFPKPPAVYDAMVRYGRDVGASPGRGHYAESREGARLIQQCRQRLCDFVGGTSPSNVIFSLNTSDALNLAIKGVVRGARLRAMKAGRTAFAQNCPIRLVTTAIDHNSVLRPFSALAEEGAEVVHVQADAVTGMVSVADVRAAISPGTSLVAINAVSNVTGAIQPVNEIATECRRLGVPCLVDAAQALGHIPFSLHECDADLLAFPGHKGLLGPQGTGGLYVRPGFEDRLATTREGGTGSATELDAQPATMPERFEAGSHNTLGIVGLSEGVAWLADRTMHAVRQHELALIEVMLEHLRSAGCRLDGSDAPTASMSATLSGLKLLGPTNPAHRTGTFSFVHDAFSPAEMAAMLEQHFGILARAGLLCAPLAHRTLGTLGGASGTGRGALRMSFGPFVSQDDVRAACAALEEVCAECADRTA